MRTIVTGGAGFIGSHVVDALVARGDEVAVIDSLIHGRKENVASGAELHERDIREPLDDIFDAVRPEAVFHLAAQADVRVSVEHPVEDAEVNVLGTRRMLEYAAEYGVKRVIVLSSGYVYGALPENPNFLDEEQPLNVSRTYPAIRDLAEVDQLVMTFLWKHPEIATTLLRPVNMLGPSSHTAIGRLLRARLVPMMAGFDPMMQFIHEEDVAAAVALALEKGTHGVFNVTGPGSVPLSVAIEECGATAVALLEPAARIIFSQLFRLGLYHTPAGAIDFLKYNCTLDGRRFVGTTGFEPRHPLSDIFASIRR